MLFKHTISVVKNGELQRHQDAKRHIAFCPKRCATATGRLRYLRHKAIKIT